MRTWGGAGGSRRFRRGDYGAVCGEDGETEGLFDMGGLMEEDTAQVIFRHKTKIDALMKDFKQISCYNSNRELQNHRDVEMAILLPPSVNTVDDK